MKKFLFAATALTAIVLGATAASAAEPVTSLDAQLASFQRLAAVPNSTGCALVSTKYNTEGRDERIKFIRGDAGCAKTAVNVRRAGTATLARTVLTDKVKANGSYDALNAYLTHLDSTGEPVIQIVQARLHDSAERGFVDYQLIADANGTETNITGSRDALSAAPVASMREALAIEMAPPAMPVNAPLYVAGSGYLQTVSAGSQGKDCVAASTFQFVGDVGGLRNTAFEADGGASCGAVHELVDEALTKPDLGLTGGQPLSSNDPRVLELLSKLAHDQLGEAKDGPGVSLGEAKIEAAESAIRIRVVTRGAQRWLAAVSYGNDNESRLRADDSVDLSGIVDNAFGG